MNLDNYEIVPDEDLWEDGEINSEKDFVRKIFLKVTVEGTWKIIRSKGETNE